MKKKFSLLILLMVFQKLYGLDAQITGKELGFYFTPEYNRAFNFCWDISAAGSIELNNRYSVNGGLAIGTTGSSFDIDLFAGGETFFYAGIPVYFSLAYKYNGLVEYENHTHSIPLLVSLKLRRAGVSLGPTFRLTSFFGGPPLFEPVLSISAYVFFIDNGFLRLGLKAANFDNFTSGNFGAYFFNLNSVARLNKKLSLVNEIEIRQSGSVTLASNFYAFVFRGGVEFSW
jgi:hypothetical protein